MTMARAHLVNPSVTRWYHCVTRCVRRAFLLTEEQAEEPHNHKEWIEHRLQELSGIFAVAVGGFSVMDNHLHVLVRLDPDVADGWSDEEVVRRWGRLFPPRDKSRKPLPVSESWVELCLKDAQWVAKTRTRLQSLSWFMKCRMCQWSVAKCLPLSCHPPVRQTFVCQSSVAKRERVAGSLASGRGSRPGVMG